MEIKLITTTFDIFEMIMNDAVESNADDYQKFLVSWIQAAAVYGIVWGIGGLLDKASRDKFDIFHRKVFEFYSRYCVIYILKPIYFCQT